MSYARSLDSDWRHIRTEPRFLATAARWALTPSPPVDLEEIRASIDHRMTANEPTAERNARRLLETAATDPLAARVLIQRMLPGLISAARRHRRLSDHALADLVACAFIAIRTFSPRRAPSHVIAALIGDASYLAFRTERRRRRPVVLPRASSDMDRLARLDQQPHPLDELIELASGASLDDHDRRVMCALLSTATVSDAADELGVTPRSVHNYQGRLAHRLRSAA